MQPFAARRCPACTADALGPSYAVVCRGGGQVFIKVKGYWFFGRRGEKLIVCEGELPSHFHIVCNHCGYRWKRLTALEEES